MLFLERLAAESDGCGASRPPRPQRVQERGERARAPGWMQTRLCRGDHGDGRSGPARREGKEIRGSSSEASCGVWLPDREKRQR